MTTTLTQRSAQVAWDTCDRCGAASAARITLSTGGLLHFCGHHLRDHHSRLREQAAEIRLAPHREALGVPGTK
jgi:hypothetical protein